MASHMIGRYEIKGELGRGGMATVYLARDPRFGREVALKVLPRELAHDATFRQRFEREAQTIAALEHSAIVPVYDFGEEGHIPYLVMRLMTGGSLLERIRQGPLSIAECATILQRIGSALDYAHSRGIIHRDLKPANVLFDTHGDAYLSDFGIVKLVESAATLTGTGIVGTAAYMSPEQIQGEKKLDGRSDIYALGVVLFQMLTGHTPYEADTPVKLMMKHVMEPVPRLNAVRPDLPSVLEETISRAMAKDPDDRFARAGEMVGHLAQAHSPLAPTARAAPRPATPAVPEPAVDETEVAVPTFAQPAAPVAGGTPSSDKPVVEVEATTPDYQVAPAAAILPPQPRQRRRWLWPALAGLAVLLVVAAVIARGGIFANRNGEGSTTEQIPPNGIEVVPLADMAPEIPWLFMTPSARPAIYTYFFNPAVPPFDEPLVRQAFALAIDREQIVQLARELDYYNTRPATTFTPAMTLGQDLYRAVGLAYDPDQAKGLLADAGYPGGEGLPPITLFTNNDVDLHHAAIAEAVIAMWHDNLGISVELELIQGFNPYLERLASDTPGLYRLNIVADTNDPSDFLEIFRSGAELNYPGWSNTGLNELLDDAVAAAGNPPLRQELYIEAERIICQEQAMVLPLFSYSPR